MTAATKAALTKKKTTTDEKETPMVKKVVRKKVGNKKVVAPKVTRSKKPVEDETEETEAPTTKRSRRARGTGTRTRRQSAPLFTPEDLTPDLRAAAAKCMSAMEDQLMESDAIGFIGAATREIPGKRIGYKKIVKFEVQNGEKLTRRQAVVTIIFK